MKDRKGRNRMMFDFIGIELTRRCNVNCAHCMKGEPQNLNIENETIDNFLDQTHIIGKLSFLGGEPTLALDKMRYILEGLKKREILLFKLECTTNGLIKSPEFVQIIKDYGEYIRWSWVRDDLDLNYHVKIQISADDYHQAAGCDYEDSYFYYKVNLYNWADVSRLTTGKFPVKKGRAVNLPEAFDPADFNFLRNDRRVEMLTKDVRPACPNYQAYKLPYEDCIYIVCDLALSAKGDLMFFHFSDHEYEFEDANIICNVNGNIYEQILEFNKGRIPCIAYLKREQQEKTALNAELEKRNAKNPNLRKALIEFYSENGFSKMDRDPSDEYYYNGQNTIIGDLKGLDEAEKAYKTHDYGVDWNGYK